MNQLDPVVWQFVALLELIVLAGAAVVLRVVCWPLYVKAMAELARVRQTADEWRGIAERALLVAQLGWTVGQRATRLSSTIDKAIDKATSP